jgi:hypothetical protein
MNCIAIDFRIAARLAVGARAVKIDMSVGGTLWNPRTFFDFSVGRVSAPFQCSGCAARGHRPFFI